MTYTTLKRGGGSLSNFTVIKVFPLWDSLGNIPYEKLVPRKGGVGWGVHGREKWDSAPKLPGTWVFWIPPGSSLSKKLTHTHTPILLEVGPLPWS